jgi:hypothetical protein
VSSRRPCRHTAPAAARRSHHHASTGPGLSRRGIATTWGPRHATLGVDVRHRADEALLPHSSVEEVVALAGNHVTKEGKQRVSARGAMCAVVEGKSELAAIGGDQLRCFTDGGCDGNGAGGVWGASGWGVHVLDVPPPPVRAEMWGPVVLSSTIRAKNQALNENMDKVMIIPSGNLGHPYFCVEGGFCLRAVDIILGLYIVSFPCETAKCM